MLPFHSYNNIFLLWMMFWKKKGMQQFCPSWTWPKAKSKDLTTFISPWGKFRFNRMPLGLRNAPATFQALMEMVLKDCSSFASVYIDDVLVYFKLGRASAALTASIGSSAEIWPNSKT